MLQRRLPAGSGERPRPEAGAAARGLVALLGAGRAGSARLQGGRGCPALRAGREGPAWRLDRCAGRAGRAPLSWPSRRSSGHLLSVAAAAPGALIPAGPRSTERRERRHRPCGAERSGAERCEPALVGNNSKGFVRKS